ncbi:hypothetical protein IWW39_004793 [Coemansia spiralis]|uniref:Uncharacterized protein n=1 Tax=Coemansia spiralis TaxID=417178 RepID=A0A9W8GIE2_9FUNG|nr:hypothetical protein IWW39_004793 [Coemansia spiralis]
MRFYLVLASVGCLLAPGRADRRVSLRNLAGKVQVYHSDDFYCHPVGSSYHGDYNSASVVGGPTGYYSDSGCKIHIFTEGFGGGTYYDISSPIKAYRALKKVVAPPV